MFFRKAKVRILLVLMLSAVCLCTGLLIFAQNDADDIVDRGVYQRVRADGQTYLACLGSDMIEVYDQQYKKLYDHMVGDDGAAIISCCISDLDGDETDEILLITGEDGNEYGTELLILVVQIGTANEQPGNDSSLENAVDTISMKVIYKKDMAYINPWKIQTCDVDGDGKTEISIGAYKTARFHPVMARRPFIYEWHGNAISPKWLGSRLSRPFDDYIFADIDADDIDELISIEHLEDGKRAVNSYAWKGFGFESIGESAAFDDILSISKTLTMEERPEKIEAQVMEAGKQRRIILRYCGEMLNHSYLCVDEEN